MATKNLRWRCLAAGSKVQIRVPMHSAWLLGERALDQRQAAKAAHLFSQCQPELPRIIAITRERKRVPQRLGFASVETLDDAHPDIQLCRQE